MKTRFSNLIRFFGVLGLPLLAFGPEVGAQTITCTASKQGANTFLISWNTVAAKVYTLEAKTNLAALWEAQAVLTATNGALSWTVPIESGARLFRVVQGEPPPAGMALIPAGEFQMGDVFRERRPDECPVHTVYVSAFYMDKYEVTKALWEEVRQWAIGHGYQFDNTGRGKETNHPVWGVSWYDMVKWCNARSEREERVPAYSMDAAQMTVYRSGRVEVQNSWVKWDAGYRLPTEAEWEKAARGGLEGRRFPWGDTISHDQANYYSNSNFDDYDVSPTPAWHPTYAIGDAPYTSPVGSFAANGYGLYDMVGNVIEWCWDWYGNSYYALWPASDPRGPTSGSRRTIRGGCWWFGGYQCRVSDRFFMDYWPDDWDGSDGFRSVLRRGQ